MDKSIVEPAIESVEAETDDGPYRMTDLTWDGRLDLHRDERSLRDALADAARGADWDRVLELLDADKHVLSTNSWRPGGKHGSTPLHRAAWHNAPISVVEGIINRGAWRTLRTSAGKTALDIAVARRHTEFVDTLTAELPKSFNFQTFNKLDVHVAQLIESRIRPTWDARLRYPSCLTLAEHPDRSLWYPVPGMYRGFHIEIMRSYLFVSSWCRIVGGRSGQAHVITTEGFTLVEEGFV